MQNLFSTFVFLLLLFAFSLNFFLLQKTQTKKNCNEQRREEKNYTLPSPCTYTYQSYERIFVILSITLAACRLLFRLLIIYRVYFVLCSFGEERMNNVETHTHKHMSTERWGKTRTQNNNLHCCLNGMNQVTMVRTLEALLYTTIRTFAW